jgi:uncharacterized protein (TIGR03437 family)
MKHLLVGVFLALSACTASAIEFWDGSGNGILKGTYYFRHVTYDTYVTGGARVMYGSITFDGEDEYTIAGWVFVPSQDSVPRPFSTRGIYEIASSGLGSVMNPIDPQDDIIGLATPSGFVGSSTEGGASDIFVAVPISRGPASLEGKLWIANFEMLDNDHKLIRNSLMSVTADGRGGLGNVAATGFAANLGDQVQTQLISEAGYFIGADGTGTMTFPSDGAPPESKLISGDKEFVVSADGNILLGGARNGLDLMVGVRALARPASDSTFAGFYSMAGVELDASASDNELRKYYGTATVDGEGHALWYERDSGDNVSWDFTFESPYSVAVDGTIERPLYRYAMGANGQALISIGKAPQYAIRLILRAPLFTGSGVFLDPMGIVNAASYASFATGVSPGELIALFGANLSPSTTSAQSVPFPRSLAGVRVLIGGLEAPLYSVSPTEVVAIVPYDLGPLPPSTIIKVVNNGQASNEVTTFLNPATPGVFTVPPTGLGPAAALHADYTPVTVAHPAERGETILVFMTGLGYVTPKAQAGNAGPTSPPTVTKYPFSVYIGGKQASVSYSGLAPGLAGLYQVNVVIPDGVPPEGSASFEIAGGSARNIQAEIPIQP